MAVRSWWRIAVWLPAAAALGAVLVPAPGPACAPSDGGSLPLVAVVVLTGAAAGTSIWKRNRRVRAVLAALAAGSGAGFFVVATAFAQWLHHCAN